MNRGIIAVGMSGGVDSSVAAYLLKKEWPRVVGVSHYIWKDSACCNTETLDRARDICGRLDIPFIVINLMEEFTRYVVNDFVESYQQGETPNPCVRCNEFVRFGIFPGEIRKRLIEKGLMDEGEALHMATGHYVRTVERDGHTCLRKGADPAKDQSYMLYRIGPDILPRCRFPLGDMRKREVVSIAEENNFPTSSIKESQDVCFVEGKYTDFIAEHVGESDIHTPGPIVTLYGMPIGTHRGYMNYTIGQRQGLGLSDGPWYVAELRAATNTVVVARKEDLGRREFRIRRPHWCMDLPDSFEAKVRVRYNSREVPCRISRSQEAAGEAIVNLGDEHVITPGQSAVVYDGELVLGGGIIQL
ncbi:MAG: tRNA 2-thiouridine(34) synthase MnmA [Sediminispirochaetaceae bacterium]